MEIRPAEISEILKKQIASFDTEANVAETGQVLSVESQTVAAPDDKSQPVSDTFLNLVTDTGIRSVDMKDVLELKILDDSLASQLHQALSTLATGHDTEQKTVTIHFGDGPARTVVAGYVTESPIWKTSYRLSLDDKPYMQGWAIVDNATDHDWNDVRLTLVSGQPISFIQDLYTPLYIPRPVVPPDVQANPYPQLAEENVLENAQAAVAGKPTAGRDQAFSRFAYPSLAPAPTAAPGRAMSITGGGANPGFADGAVWDDNGADMLRYGVTSQATGQKAGELFQYRVKNLVSIPRQQSAMIPIVTDDVKAEKTDLYNADMNPANPLNGLELTNTTGMHLKAGPVTILDAGSYAGDARMPELEPNDTQLITYAVDLGVTGLRETPPQANRLVSIVIKKGVLTLTSRSEVTTKYTFKNKLDKDRAILVEQPIKPTWDLVEPAKPDEKTRSYYRFKVNAPATASTDFKVVESHLDYQTVGLLNADIDFILQYRTNAVASPAVQAALADVAAKKQKIAQIQTQIDGQRTRINTITMEQDRIRQNMAQLDQTSALYKRYVGELDDQETQLGKIRADLDRLQVDLTQAQTDLNNAVANLDVE